MRFRIAPLGRPAYSSSISGRLAQLVRASRLHRECRGFESLTAHHPRDFGVTATMRHGSGKLASNTGDADSTSSAGGFLANSATDMGGAGESPHTRNAAKDGAGTRVSVSARAAQPPRRGSERLATRGAWRVGFRGVGRRTSGARSDPKNGLGGRSAPTRPRSPDPKPKIRFGCANPL